MSSTNPKAYETTSPRKVAFLGLGVMGFPMAGHLALAGHDVTVYNRSPDKAQAWISCSVAWATTTTCARSCSATTAPWPG
jgi:3-hydroxyisobutyrate dehydrogenase/2-hydroxy-3-oxopropionate reductase